MAAVQSSLAFHFTQQAEKFRPIEIGRCAFADRVPMRGYMPSLHLEIA